MGTAQSTKWAWNSPTGTSPRLIDGKGIDGRWSSIGCAGTSDAYRPEKLIESAGREWFSLELDAPQKIARVQIAKRTDCCSERARNIQITIGPSKGYDPNEPLCLPEIDSLAGPGMQEYVCEGELHEGKFVKISRAGVMNLCEVKIFGAA